MANSERVQPLYYDKEVLIKSPQILYRTNVGDRRYYYTIKPSGDVVRFASVTTVLQATMPTSEYLIKWISEHGYKRAEEIANQKAKYGTLMHICFSQFFIKGFFDLASIPARIETFKIDNGIDYRTDFWANELEKDMRAIEVFAAIHDVKPLAISLMLASENLGIAGELDIVLDMKIGSGVNGSILKTDMKINKHGEITEDRTRRVVAIQDWKSGRHGFYPNNEAQLHMYKDLWNETYPHIQIDALYNWSPKNWETEPSYNLKDQMSSVEQFKIKHYIELYKLSGYNNAPMYYPKQTGVLQLGRRNGNFKLETFEEKVLRFHHVEKPKAEPTKAEIKEEIKELRVALKETIAEFNNAQGDTLEAFGIQPQPTIDFEEPTVIEQKPNEIIDQLNSLLQPQI